MGFLKRALEDVSPEMPMGGGSGGENLIAAFGGNSNTVAGQRVTIDSAERIATVYSAIRAYTDAISSIEMKLYRETEHGRELAITQSHPLGRPTSWELLCEEANPEMSSIDLYEICMHQLQLYGNSFIWKERDSRGLVRALWPTHTGAMTVARVNGVKTYAYIPVKGGSIMGTDRDFLHVKASTPNGNALLGLSPINQTRQRLGIISAQEQFQGSFYKNSATPAGMLSTPQEIDAEGMKRLAAEFQEKYGGTSNAGQMIFLEHGLEYKALTMPLQEQQFMEQTEASVQDIARIFRLPSFKLNAGVTGTNSLTYTNAVGQNETYWSDSLNPWLGKIERALRRDGDILSDPALRPVFDVSNLLRADPKTKAEVDAIYLKSQTVTPNEVRKELGKGPRPDGNGDEPLIPESIKFASNESPENAPQPDGK